MAQKSEAFENIPNEETTEESATAELDQLLQAMFDKLDEPLATEIGKTSPTNQLLKTDYDEFNNLSAEELDNTSPIEPSGLPESQGGETTADNSGLNSSTNKNMYAPTAEGSHTDFSGSLGLFDDDLPLSLPVLNPTVTPIKTATVRSIKLDCFDQSFRKMINSMRLQSMGIHNFHANLSQYDQCQALVNTQINESIKSALFTHLKEESKKFKVLEKTLSKTLQSTNINTRIESREYVFSLGFDIKNSELASVIFLNVNRKDIEADLNKIIKKAQRKKSRSKSTQQKKKLTVLIQRTNLDKLIPDIKKTPKAAVLRDLFELFLKIPSDEQLSVIREIRATELKKAMQFVTKESHIKTDFLVSNEKDKAIKKLLEKHAISMQELTNILVNSAINKCSWFSAHAEKIEKAQVTDSVKACTEKEEPTKQPSTPQNGMYDSPFTAEELKYL